MLPAEATQGLERIDDQVWVVPGAAQGGRNSLLVDDGEVVLFDAGLPDALARRLARFVDACILTHCEADVVHGARHFREVWAPHAEARALLSTADYLETYGVVGRDRPIVEGALVRSGWAPRPPDRRYRPKGMVQLASTRWEMVAAPGHTPGLTLFLEPKRHYLFAADLDGSDAPLYALPVSDLDELLKSLESMAELDVAVLVGHRAPPRRRGIRQMYRDQAAALRARDLAVLQRLDTPRTLEDLAGSAPFSGERPPADGAALYTERILVEKHLARLIGRDLVMARQDGRYQRVD